MKTVGIVGGLGWESTAIYYRVMNREVRRRLGGWHSSRLVIDSLDFQQFAEANCRDDYGRLREKLVESALRLEGAGCDLILIACNTAHRFSSSIVDAVQIPLLHIADAAGNAVHQAGHRRVALLGTRATMEGDFYRKRLENSFGLEVLVPGKETRDELNTLILEELHSGRDPTACAPRLDGIIEGLASEGATAVLLACTELGLIFGGGDNPMLARTLPSYDTAILHALAAVEDSLAGTATLERDETH